MNLILMLPPISFLVILFVWSFVFAYKRKDPVTRSYLLFSGFCVAWTGLELLFYVPAFNGDEHIIMSMTVPFWTLLGVVFLYFTYQLLEKKTDWILGVSLIISLASMVITLMPGLVLYGFSRNYWGPAEIHDPVLHSLISLPGAASGGYGVFLIVAKYFSSKKRETRAIMGTLFLGGVITLPIIFMLNVILPNFFGLCNLPRYGSFTTSLFAILTFVAVRKNRFLIISLEQVAEDLFLNMRDGVILLDNGNKVRRINRAAALMLNVSGADVVDVDFKKILSSAGLSRGGQSNDLKIERDGKIMIIELSRPVNADVGEDYGRIIILRDVTEQRRAQKVLRQSRDLLEREVKERKTELRQAQRLEALVTLSGGIAHEFNNLLAAVIGFTTAAQDDLSVTHPVQEDLTEILRAARRAKDIVQQLLSLSDKCDPKPRKINIAHLATEAIKMLQLSRPENVRTNLNLENQNVGVFVDPSRLHQVLLNLITNAYHAMANLGGVLKLTVRSFDVDKDFAKCNSPLEPGEHVAVIIEDTGIGITPENLEKIFDPFFTTKAEGVGTGLGLATAMRIVQEYNGIVIVDSTMNIGTTFTVILPSFDYVANSILDSEATFIATGTEHILLVDDKQQVLKVGCRMLEPLGYMVTACSDPLEALEFFQKDPDSFDVMLTDLSMPKMNGLSLGREILAIKPDFPIVLLSGNLSVRDKEQAEKIGFNVMLTKPFTKAALAKGVRAALNLKEEM